MIKRFSPNRRPATVVTDPLTNQSIVEIEWADQDALPFPLCISSKTDEEHGAKEIADVSVATRNHLDLTIDTSIYVNYLPSRQR